MSMPVAQPARAAKKTVADEDTACPQCLGAGSMCIACGKPCFEDMEYCCLVGACVCELGNKLHACHCGMCQGTGERNEKRTDA
jgi:hypothetical protein